MKNIFSNTKIDALISLVVVLALVYFWNAIQSSGKHAGSSTNTAQSLREVKVVGEICECLSQISDTASATAQLPRLSQLAEKYRAAVESPVETNDSTTEKLNDADEITQQIGLLVRTRQRFNEEFHRVMKIPGVAEQVGSIIADAIEVGGVLEQFAKT